METFISCDWGTSQFRLRLINTATARVLAEIKTSQGIAATFAAWKKEAAGSDRFLFYNTIISEAVNTLAQQYNFDLNDNTIVISGMASSSIGMIELPYKSLPFSADGKDLLTHIIQPSANCKQRIVVVSGVKTNVDVMRGEETKLAGCNIPKSDAEQIFIFPGTHSKHITVKNGIAQNFKTFMTGELFDLLCTKSVLAASVETNDSLSAEENKTAFLKGVEHGAATNILNSIFHVRTNQLFTYFTPAENYHYLSGLLIGAELKDLLQKPNAPAILVAAPLLAQPYLLAMEMLNISNYADFIHADEALISGQQKIFMQFKNS